MYNKSATCFKQHDSGTSQRPLASSEEEERGRISEIRQQWPPVVVCHPPSAIGMSLSPQNVRLGFTLKLF